MTENQKLLAQYAVLRRLFSLETAAVLKESQLGFRQFVILHTLIENEKRTLTELVETCMTDKATVTRSVSQLISAGLVQKFQSKRDGRVWHVELTTKGKEFVPYIDDIHRDLSDIFFGSLDPAEKQTLRMLLNKLIQSLIKATNGDLYLSTSQSPH